MCTRMCTRDGHIAALHFYTSSGDQTQASKPVQQAPSPSWPLLQPGFKYLHDGIH